MAYGVQTWNASGVKNNYGIKPVSVAGYMKLALSQKTGTYTVSSVPSGFKLNYYHVPNNTENQTGVGRRRIRVSGNSIIVSSAGDTEFSSETFHAVRAFVVVTIERA